MIRNMRIRKDKTAKTGKLFKIDMGNNAYETLAITEAEGVADDCLLYGYNVYLQKRIGEAGKKKNGRDWTLVKAHLDEIRMEYTVEDYVVGEKIEDEYTALKKDYTIEEIKEALALRKASKE